MLEADGLAEAGAGGVGTAEPEDQVERKEQGRPARTEPTGEERSNKLKIHQELYIDESFTHPFPPFNLKPSKLKKKW